MNGENRAIRKSGQLKEQLRGLLMMIFPDGRFLQGFDFTPSRIEIGNHPGKGKRNFGLKVAVLASLGIISLANVREVHAGTGSSFLEAVGVGIAVGTVLGASTLPFYEQPGKNVINLAYGASAGAILGVGAWVYSLFGQARDEEEVQSEGLRFRFLAQNFMRVNRRGRCNPGVANFGDSFRNGNFSLINPNGFASGERLAVSFVPPIAERSPVFWAPLVSLTW